VMMYFFMCWKQKSPANCRALVRGL